MTRELLILRHGKSDWDAGTNDYHRPLTSRGIKSSQRIGNWLAQENLVPDLTISSTATRAMSTAEYVLNSLGKGVQDIQKNKTLYLAELIDILSVLADSPDSARRVMIVGHNPGLEELLDYLLPELPVSDDGKFLPTATLARLHMPESWAGLVKGCASLLSLVRPASLPDKFPFPGQEGNELRNQPAYYYQQASVLPYRISEEGKIEFLLIRSRKQKKWILPKGIQDPGKTARETAVIEAREEAGVEGEIADNPIMTYEYNKWGGTCTVQVFPLRVTNILPEEEWEERYRGRKWVKAKTAIKRIQQKSLKTLFTDLGDTLVNSD
jgi:phosphohistidine phosphatase